VSNCQSFNRTIAPNARALIARAEGGKWRFFVSSTQLTLVEIVQRGSLGNFPAKREYCAPNSAIEFQGLGAVDVYATNLSSTDPADLQSYDAGYLCAGLERVEYAENQLTTPSGGFLGAMGSFGGYPAPFCNMVRLYVDLAQQTRIAAYDPYGDVVFQSGIQPVDERLYIDLDAPQGYRWEIRESSSSETGVNYTVIWFRG